MEFPSPPRLALLIPGVVLTAASLLLIRPSLDLLYEWEASRLPEPPAPEAASPRAPPTAEVLTVTTGGASLSAIAARLEILDEDLVALVDSTPFAWPLLKMHLGGTLTLTRDGSRLRSLSLEGNDGSAISFERSGRGFVMSADPAAVRSLHAQSAVAPEPTIAGTVADDADAAAAPNHEPPPVSVEVARGDSLYSIFQRLGFSASELVRLVASGPEGKRLTRLRPGDRLEFRGEASAPLTSVLYRPTATLALEFTRTPDGEFVVATHHRAYRRELTSETATIRSSLFAAAAAAGIPDSVTMKLVEIFGWDVDFALDIRAGDSLTVLHEQRYLDDRYIGPGEVVAAEFRNRGTVYRAVRYSDASGRSDYFTPDGDRLRRAFIRTPVRFARISSRYDLRRLHPVLHTLRAHRGVDYAAPTGTPIRAAGDGRVIWLGRKGGYGKAVILQHGGVYTTLYAHMSRYGDIRRGSRVAQGETIGYVGSTGLATGPHLHYEFRVNGAHRDPLTVPLPRAERLGAGERDRFTAATAPILQQLEHASRTTLAQVER